METKSGGIAAGEEMPKQETITVEPLPNVRAELPSNPDAPITTAQLLSLLQTMAASSTQSTETLAKTLAAAIVDAQKPYVDPKKEQNEETFRRMSREQREQTQKDTHANQVNCPHIAGCNSLSEFRDHMGRTSIIWHKYDSGEVMGLCTNCQRIFRSIDSDYQMWFSKPRFNRASQSGQREYADPLAAQRRARGDAEPFV